MDADLRLESPQGRPAGEHDDHGGRRVQYPAQVPAGAFLQSSTDTVLLPAPAVHHLGQGVVPSGYGLAFE
jgi:hypothetical protein